MHVKEATESDVDGIRSVAEAAWSTDYPNILNRDRVDEGVEEWYGVEQLRESVGRSRDVYLVAERDGETVGFVHGLYDGDVGHVLRLYVHPDHRGEGIGTDLFEAVRERLVDRGVDRVRAMVLAANTPGNEFYRALGLEKVDEGETTVGGDTYPENVYEG